LKDFNNLIDKITAYLCVILIILFFSVVYGTYLHRRDKQAAIYMESYEFQADKNNYLISIKSEDV
jgi:hypothetical protein